MVLQNHQKRIETMKKFIIAFMFVFAVSANAADNCTEIAELAKSIMSARQNGVPMVELVGAIKKSDTNEALRNFMFALAKHAYSYPHMSVKRNKQRYINEFQNEYYLACIK